MPWHALVGVFYDDGLYAVLGRAIAEGRGYRMLHLPGAPVAVHYPPGYPLLLALLWRLGPDFPANVLLMRAANAVLLGAAAGIAAAYVARRAGLDHRVAALLVGASSLAVPLLAVTTVLFAEPLFLALLVGACWAADAAVEGPRSRSLALAGLAGILAGASALTRSIGVAAVAGVVLAALARGRWGAALAAMVPAAALVVPWQAFVASHRGAVDPLIVANYGSYGAFLSQGGLQVSLASLGEMARPLGAVALPPIGPLLPLAAVPALATLIFGLGLLARRAPALGATLIVYLAIVALWPYAPHRFLWAALPLMAVAFGVGAQGLWNAGGAVRVRVAARAVAGTAVLAVLAGYGARQGTALALGHATAAQRGISETMRVMVEWVREATDTADVVAGEDEALLWLYTGRRAVPNHLWAARGRSAESLGPDSLKAWLDRNRATHLILTGPGSGAAPDVDALMGRWPGYLEPVRVWPGGLMAFSVRRSGPPPAPR